MRVLELRKWREGAVGGGGERPMWKDPGLGRAGPTKGPVVTERTLVTGRSTLRRQKDCFAYGARTRTRSRIITPILRPCRRRSPSENHRHPADLATTVRLVTADGRVVFLFAARHVQAPEPRVCARFFLIVFQLCLIVILLLAVKLYRFATHIFYGCGCRRDIRNNDQFSSPGLECFRAERDGYRL